MAYVDKDTVSVTTASDGSATAYSRVFRGGVSAIRYVKSTFDNGAKTFTITVEDTAENLWVETASIDASTTRYPRQFIHDPDDGTEDAAVVDMIQVANSRIKIVIAGGGNAKAGSFIIIGNGTFSG